MAKQLYRWVFTYNQPDGVDETAFRGSFLESFKKLLTERCKKWEFQLERGEESLLLHYQGRVGLAKKLVLSGVKSLLKEHPTIHWESERDERASEDYVWKEDTRVDGPWSSKDVASYVPRAVRTMELRGWQIELRDLLAKSDDDRSIHFVLDNTGNIGKSSLCRYLACREGGIVLPGTIDTADNLMKMASVAIGRSSRHRIILLDLPRAIPKKKWSTWLSALEQLKDGHITDWRAGSFTDRWIEPPSIAVFTNKLPPTGLLSADRFRFHHPNSLDGPLNQAGLIIAREEEKEADVIDLSQDSD